MDISKDLVFTVKEFCQIYRISRQYLYLLWKRKLDPRRMRLGKKVLITSQAAQEWQRRMEEPEQ